MGNDGHNESGGGGKEDEVDDNVDEGEGEAEEEDVDEDEEEDEDEDEEEDLVLSALLLGALTPDLAAWRIEVYQTLSTTHHLCISMRRSRADLPDGVILSKAAGKVPCMRVRWVASAAFCDAAVE